MRGARERIQAAKVTAVWCLATSARNAARCRSSDERSVLERCSYRPRPGCCGEGARHVAEPAEPRPKRARCGDPGAERSSGDELIAMNAVPSSHREKIDQLSLERKYEHGPEERRTLSFLVPILPASRSGGSARFERTLGIELIASLRRRQPRVAGLAIDVAEVDAGSADINDAEDDGEVKPARPYRAGVEDGDAAIAPDKRDV
jgi:hypothetical protein